MSDKLRERIEKRIQELKKFIDENNSFHIAGFSNNQAVARFTELQELLKD